uniref:bZIP transcription factor 53-like n=1 Tax=Erigeron canadensis TaxID=72917 RepID=UPI001CB97796|nr:bZIP transcription factor 53-like [Erigeron canadensis]
MSSKGYLMVDDDQKKMKRKISNRESAKRSRMKKEQHIKDLNDQIFYLTKKRDEMATKMDGVMKDYVAIETNNMVLRSQKQELEKRLEYAKNVCEWHEVDGFLSLSSIDAVQEPWLRPSNSMSMIMSSVGNFQF